MILAFGDCELDLDRYELRRAGLRVPIEPQVFDVLVHLASHPDRWSARRSCSTRSGVIAS